VLIGVLGYVRAGRGWSCLCGYFVPDIGTPSFPHPLVSLSWTIPPIVAHLTITFSVRVFVLLVHCRAPSVELAHRLRFAVRACRPSV
jgi:hypothetical protein